MANSLKDFKIDLIYNYGHDKNHIWENESFVLRPSVVPSNELYYSHPPGFDLFFCKFPLSSRYIWDTRFFRPPEKMWQAGEKTDLLELIRTNNLKGFVFNGHFRGVLSIFFNLDKEDITRTSPLFKPELVESVRSGEFERLLMQEREKQIGCLT